jgi:hypothetical protein
MKPRAIILTDQSQGIFQHTREYFTQFDVSTVVPAGEKGNVAIGESCHHGKGLCERVVEAVACMTGDWCLLAEGDTLPVRPVPEILMSSGAIVGLWFGSEPGQPWKARGFPHGCLTMIPQWAVVPLVEAGRWALRHDHLEGGYSDRFLGYMIQLSGVGVRSVGRETFCSYNRVEDNLSETIGYVRQGAEIVHGVKEAKTIELLLNEVYATGSEKGL